MQYLFFCRYEQQNFAKNNIQCNYKLILLIFLCPFLHFITWSYFWLVWKYLWFPGEIFNLMPHLINCEIDPRMCLHLRQYHTGMEILCTAVWQHMLIFDMKLSRRGISILLLFHFSIKSKMRSGKQKPIKGMLNFIFAWWFSNLSVVEIVTLLKCEVRSDVNPHYISSSSNSLPFFLVFAVWLLTSYFQLQGWLLGWVWFFFLSALWSAVTWCQKHLLMQRKRFAVRMRVKFLKRLSGLN